MDEAEALRRKAKPPRDSQEVLEAEIYQGESSILRERTGSLG